METKTTHITREQGIRMQMRGFEQAVATWKKEGIHPLPSDEWIDVGKGLSSCI